jgi:putative redox protein
MKIKTRYIDEMKFEIVNNKTATIINAKEMSPVEVFTGAMISCSGVDIVHLATKQGYEIKKCEIEADVVKKDTYPQTFKEVTFIYDIQSLADDVVAKRWVLSSLETYCSTINNIRNTTKIYYTIKHNSNLIAYKEAILSGNSAGGHQLENFDDDLEGMGCACCNH